MKKIAFCFLIYDVINHEELWNLFFKNVDHNKYNIYIHYKTNRQLSYFNKYKLKNCISTNYSDQTIVHAYNILFKKAFEEDEENYKFIILSGACIPFKSFDYIYEKLTGDSYGYFNSCPREQCFPTCDSLSTKIDKKYISKSHNWFILNRLLVEQLAYLDNAIIDHLYGDVYAPAEYYYYTFIKKLQLEEEVKVTENKSYDATTFTCWQPNLVNFSSISKEEISKIVNSKSLFGRKFNQYCLELYDIDYINSIIC
jgi:hypothetical protein